MSIQRYTSKMIGLLPNSAQSIPDSFALSHAMAKRWRAVLFLGIAACALSLPAQTPASDDEEAARYAQAGQQALAAGRYPEARENFEKLAKLHPNLAEIHANLIAGVLGHCLSYDQLTLSITNSDLDLIL